MKILGRIGLMLATSAALVACSGESAKYRQHMYWKNSQVIAPVVVPSDIRVKPALGYYPAPAVGESGDHRPPSLIPPGSKIEYYKEMNRMKNRGPQK